MDRKIVWSVEALGDLEAIHAFIAKDSPVYAAATVQELYDAGTGLGKFAQRGRVVPEYGNVRVRELFVREYRLIYQVQSVRVVMLAIIHGKRDLNRIARRSNF